jgi:hypothetical protein
MNRDIDDQLFMVRARRAYEWGRLRGGAWRAALLAAATALAGTSLVDRDAWLLAPCTFLLWLAAWWRGGALLKAAQYGLGAGLITVLLPVSLLRPCCRAVVNGTTPVCTMPEMCVFIGALLGLPLASLVLRHDHGRRLEAAAGMTMGVLSLAAVKCSVLFAGETLGLLAGLAIGFVAAAGFSALQTRNA